jgi:hypothetical protein
VGLSIIRWNILVPASFLPGPQHRSGQRRESSEENRAANEYLAAWSFNEKTGCVAGLTFDDATGFCRR